MTNLSDIYDTFLSNISDYSIANLLSTEADELLFRYFKSARARFYKCKNRLDILEDINGNKFFGYKEDIQHTVKRKVDEVTGEIVTLDTLQSIADKYNVTIEELRIKNSPLFDVSDSLDEVKQTDYTRSRVDIVIIPNYITVTVELNNFEIEIIAKLMIVEYLKPIILSSEILKQGLSDKDFKIYSQANQLRELSLLYRLMQKESKKMITEYTYMGMTDNDSK